eukprot:COSAG05_NODE_17790_length_319_cov_0.695455_1_plen_99_part_10
MPLQTEEQPAWAKSLLRQVIESAEAAASAAASAAVAAAMESTRTQLPEGVPLQLRQLPAEKLQELLLRGSAEDPLGGVGHETFVELISGIELYYRDAVC